eukprot:UN04524
MSFQQEQDEAQQVRQIATSCRFYQSEFPQVDDVVMAQITAVEQVGAMVTLLEYGGIQGMILASEISRRRFRSIKQVVQVGKTIPCTVIRVDPVKGYIDLSKKRVSVNDTKQAEDRYANSRHVHSIMARVAHITKRSLLELYQMFIWDLYKEFKHAYYAFNALANNDLSVLDKYTQVPQDVKDVLLQTIKQKMAPKPCTIFARIEATCYGEMGITGLKKAFEAGIAQQTEQVKLRLRIVGPPVYVITTTCNVQTQGMQIVKQAIEAISTEIQKYGGKASSELGPQLADGDIDVDKLGNTEAGEDDDEDDEYDEDDEDSDY